MVQRWLRLPLRRVTSRLRGTSHRRAIALLRLSRVIREGSAVPSVAVRPAVGAARALPAAPQALEVPCTLRLHQLQRPRRTLLPAAVRTEASHRKRKRLFHETE